MYPCRPPDCTVTTLGWARSGLPAFSWPAHVHERVIEVTIVSSTLGFICMVFSVRYSPVSIMSLILRRVPGLSIAPSGIRDAGLLEFHPAVDRFALVGEEVVATSTP